MASASLKRPLDILVIGAGVSGLSCARELLRRSPGISLSVLEANDRVGGRTLADSEGTDLGAGYIGPGQDHILAIVEELGLKLTKVYTAGKTTQCLHDVVSYYQGLVPPISPIGTIDLNTAMQEMERLVNLCDMNDPRKTPNAVELDRTTVQQAIEKLCWTSEARSVLRTAIRAIMCAEPCEVSTLGLLWYIKRSGGTRRIFETENGAQDSKVVGGYGIVAPMMAARLPAGTVRLNKPVRTIDSRDATTVTVTCSDGERFVARTVVLAIAPVQQLRIEYLPALPSGKMQALQQFKMGHIIKTFTYYDTPFWREKKLNGSAVCDDGIVVVSMDDTKPDGTLPCIMGFVLTDQATKYATMSTAVMMEALGAHYAKLFKDERGRRPLRIKRKNWSEEPWVGGCYTSVPGPLCLTVHLTALEAPLAEGRILVAGTEVAKVNSGYVDGAVEAGERIARNALVKLGQLPSREYDVMITPPPSKLLPLTPLEYTWIETHLPSMTSFIVAGAASLVGVAAFLVTRWW